MLLEACINFPVPVIHGGLGAQGFVRGLASAGNLQRAVATQPVAVVGILVAAEYLPYALAHHLQLSVMDELTLARVWYQAADLPGKRILHATG